MQAAMKTIEVLRRVDAPLHDVGGIRNSLMLLGNMAGKRSVAQ